MPAATHELKIERLLTATPQRVFHALTRADAVKQWLGPTEAFKVAVHLWDCRVGGKYRVEFQSPEGETRICAGGFKTVVPASKLAFSWIWEDQPAVDSLVTFTLRAQRGKTHLTLTHEGLPATTMEEGWTGALGRLADSVS